MTAYPHEQDENPRLSQDDLKTDKMMMMPQHVNEIDTNSTAASIGEASCGTFGDSFSASSIGGMGFRVQNDKNGLYFEETKDVEVVIELNDAIGGAGSESCWANVTRQKSRLLQERKWCPEKRELLLDNYEKVLHEWLVHSKGKENQSDYS